MYNQLLRCYALKILICQNCFWFSEVHDSMRLMGFLRILGSNWQRLDVATTVLPPV